MPEFPQRRDVGFVVGAQHQRALGVAHRLFENDIERRHGHRGSRGRCLGHLVCGHLVVVAEVEQRDVQALRLDHRALQGVLGVHARAKRGDGFGVLRGGKQCEEKRVRQRRLARGLGAARPRQAPRRGIDSGKKKLS
ncbi:hypothetical protein D3C72_1540640 [compost metagenome]